MPVIVAGVCDLATVGGALEVINVMITDFRAHGYFEGAHSLLILDSSNVSGRGRRLFPKVALLWPWVALLVHESWNAISELAVRPCAISQPVQRRQR